MCRLLNFDQTVLKVKHISEDTVFNWTAAMRINLKLAQV